MRLLIVDGLRLVGEALANAFAPRLEIAGVLTDGLAVFAWLDTNHADVVLVDLCLPSKPGRQVIGELRFLYPDLRILATFAHDGPGYRESLRYLGANGFAPKSVSLDLFREALEATAAGVPWTARPEVFIRSGTRTISSVEHQVLECVADLPVKAIARRLHQGHRTIELHLSRLRRFFGVSTNAELVKEAIWRGHLPIGSL